MPIIIIVIIIIIIITVAVAATPCGCCSVTPPQFPVKDKWSVNNVQNSLTAACKRTINVSGGKCSTDQQTKTSTIRLDKVMHRHGLGSILNSDESTILFSFLFFFFFFWGGDLRLTSPLTARVVRTPKMISQPISSIFLCSLFCFVFMALFNCISFHKFSQKLSAFSLCSSGLMFLCHIGPFNSISLYESPPQPWYNPLRLTTDFHAAISFQTSPFSKT